MKCLVIRHLSIQNMNAITGQVYGAVGIVPSLGFVHALQRKLNSLPYYDSLVLSGCVVVVHYQHVHTYYNEHHSLKFLQSRNPAVSLHGVDNAKKSVSPAVIEEGKMNAEISLIVPYDYDGTLQSPQEEHLKEQISNLCGRLRFAGGMILNRPNVSFHYISHDDESNKSLRQMIRPLLPGFVLYQCSDVLAEHLADNPDIDELQGLMDFIGFKAYAHPEHHLIDEHLKKLNSSENNLWSIWQAHLKERYSTDAIPNAIKQYFDTLDKPKGKLKDVLKQWADYCNPTNKTDAYWSYLPKPAKGYFVPMMCGYKAISSVYPAEQVSHVRDENIDVCFVEAVHTLAQWQGIHRIRTVEDLQNAVWHYDYQQHWYLCQQGKFNQQLQPQSIVSDDYDHLFF